MGRKASFVALIILTTIVAPPSAFFLYIGILGTIYPNSPIPGPVFLISALIFLIPLALLWLWWYMFEFFKGWRRKAGCVTLVVACALASTWLISYYIDTGTFDVATSKDTFYAFQATQGVLMWAYHGYGAKEPDMGIPFWAITIPVTILSAYLLLSKPRPRAPKTGEPAPTTGP